MTAFAIILASLLHFPSASSFAFAPSHLPSLSGRVRTLTPHCPRPTAMSSANDDDASETAAAPETVVIAGAGVVGTSTAYYLAVDHGIRSILVDPTGRIAPAASGKAGGFLALDWNDMSPLRKLARRSFALHESLASDENLGAKSVMYRRLTCSAVSVDPRRAGRRPGGKKLAGVEWAEDGDDGGGGESSPSAVLGSRVLGDERTIAQVHPKMLCDALWEEAKRRRGCALVEGEVAEPVYRERDGDDDEREGGIKKLAGVRLSNGEIVECDAVLFACGPWTSHNNDLMTGVKYHSAVIPTPRVLTQSVFFDGCGDPEVYPRPDSTAYCTGFPDPAVRVEERPGEEEVRPEAIRRILNAVRSASGEGGALGAKPAVEQACYLPTTPDGLPMMGPLPGTAGGPCYVAAGHGCWGILLGPGTGETMASLIATGKSTRHVDLRPFDPSRFV